MDSLENRRLLDSDVEGVLQPIDHGIGCGCGHCGNDNPKFVESLEKLGLLDGREYQATDRWTSTATNPSTGSSGNPVTLTWGLVADGLSISGYAGEPASPSNLQARLNTLYGSSSTWLPVFQQVFDRWSQLTGITFVYVTYDDGAAFQSSNGFLNVRPDIRIAGHPIDGAGGILAYNFYPSGGGDMVIDTADLTGGGYMTNLSNNSRRLRNVVSHEVGHGIGMAHVIPVDQTKLMEPNVSTAFDGPQFDDILGVQRLYGDPFEKSGRNETAGTATTLGAMPLGSSTLVQQVTVGVGSDADFFRINLATDRRVSLNLLPEGSPYLQGPQNGTATNFDPSSQADLRFDVFASNGTTLLASVNATAAGASEAISLLDLPAGDFFVRVAGTGNAQMYRLTGASTTLVRGDMNVDGVVNNQDIAGFTLALTDFNAFVSQNGFNPTVRGDVNRDGVFNNQDIEPFVALLTGGRPAPEQSRRTPLSGIIPPRRTVFAGGNPLELRDSPSASVESPRATVLA
jgi:hypothetical protein